LLSEIFVAVAVKFSGGVTTNCRKLGLSLGPENLRGHTNDLPWTHSPSMIRQSPAPPKSDEQAWQSRSHVSKEEKAISPGEVEICGVMAVGDSRGLPVAIIAL
jgi:hypothetical protein